LLIADLMRSPIYREDARNWVSMKIFGLGAKFGKRNPVSPAHGRSPVTRSPTLAGREETRNRVSAKILGKRRDMIKDSC